MVVAMFDYMPRPQSDMSGMVMIGHKGTRAGEMTSEIYMTMFSLGAYQ